MASFCWQEYLDGTNLLKEALLALDLKSPFG